MPKHSGDHHGRRRLAAFIVAVLAVAIAFFGGFLSYHAIKPTTGGHGTHLAAVGAAHDRLNASVPTLSPDEVEKAKHGHTYRDFRIVKRVEWPPGSGGIRKDADFEDWVKSGSFVNSLQDATVKALGIALAACNKPVANAKLAKSQSPYDDPLHLKMSGWSPENIGTASSIPAFNELYAVLRDLRVSTRNGDFENAAISWKHDQEADRRIAQPGLLPTHAFYQNIYNARQGVIITVRNRSPNAMIDDLNLRQTHPDIKPPMLSQWSDVAFLAYLSAATKIGVKITKLKLVFQLTCTTPDTRWVVSMVLGGPASGEEVRAPLWGERKIFRRQGDQTEAKSYNALLGTPHGLRVAWLLLQHQVQLGFKRIRQISVFTQTDSSSRYKGPSLLFELEDVPQADLVDDPTKFMEWAQNSPDLRVDTGERAGAGSSEEEEEEEEEEEGEE